jgi:uncharacterized protein YbjT (DUF2867 family)
MILVTGGTGTSGTPVVDGLRSKGIAFRMLARNPQKLAAMRGPGIEVVAGDLARPETLAAAMKGIEKAFLLSPPVPNQAELEGGFVRAAKEAGVRHIVKFSAMTADVNVQSRFPRAHGQVEKQIRESGISWTFLRPTFFMQNLLGFAEMVRHGVIYQPAGQGRASFVDSRDIAAVAVAALSESGHEGKAYEITGPQLLNYDDVAAIFAKVTGKSVKYQDITVTASKQAMLAMGMPEWNVDGINELMDQMRAGKYAVLSDVVKTVGHKTPVTLEQFVRENNQIWA